MDIELPGAPGTVLEMSDGTVYLVLLQEKRLVAYDLQGPSTQRRSR